MGLEQHMEWWGTISFGLSQECKFWLITIPSGKAPFHHDYFKEDINEYEHLHPSENFLFLLEYTNQIYKVFNSLETILVKIVVLFIEGFPRSFLRMQELLSYTLLAAESYTKIYLF